MHIRGSRIDNFCTFYVIRTDQDSFNFNSAFAYCSKVTDRIKTFNVHIV